MHKQTLQGAIAAGLLLICTTVAASDACTGVDSEECRQVAQTRLLTEALQARSAALAASSAAEAALNQARFAFAGSNEIKPNTGKADTADGQKIQEWLALYAATQAAKSIGSKLINNENCSKMMLARDNTIFTMAAERVRLREALKSLEDELNAIKKSEASAGVKASNFSLGGIGGGLQSLAATSGLFVTDFNLHSSESTVETKLLFHAIASQNPARFLDADRISLDSKTLDSEIQGVRNALMKLNNLIKNATGNTKKTLQAQLESGQKSLAAIFDKGTSGLSIFESALIYDSLTERGACTLVVGGKSYGALLSAVRRFSSGSYTTLSTATIDFRLVDAKGDLKQAGVESVRCRWQVPVRTKDTGASPVCKAVKR
jgi:hypothetical protein